MRAPLSTACQAQGSGWARSSPVPWVRAQDQSRLGRWARIAMCSRVLGNLCAADESVERATPDQLHGTALSGG
jgi:hypothetical protein